MTKRLLILLLVVVVALVAWRKLPGLRHRATTALDEFGGWTEDARRADPVGFIEFAEKRLGEDLAAFQKAQTDLAQAKVAAEEELARSQDRFAAANLFAEEFRTAFQGAEAAGSFPVTVRGSQYTRADLVDQVSLLLLERDNYAEIIDGFERVLGNVEVKTRELVTRIQTTRATLTKLKPQKEIARIDKLTGDADKLLADVDELLGENANALGDLRTPVRTVEDLMSAKPAEKPSAGDDAATLEFLTGGA